MSVAIKYGTVTAVMYEEVGGGKLLYAKAEVDGRPTDWLPVKTKASSLIVRHDPVALEDQVIVFAPFGENSDGYIDCNIAYKATPLPIESNEHTVVVSIEDGTKYIHDFKNKTISMNTPCDIVTKTNGTITLEANEITLKAKEITLDALVKTTDDLKVAKKIFDTKGNITDHLHSVVGHSKAIPR